MNRHYLFLQGVSSPFLSTLEKQLSRDGQRVTKIAFNAGDLAYWWPRSSIVFRKKIAELSAFLQAIYHKLGITDQVLFGDRRPVHRIAITQARLDGVRNHVFEEGYFRPYWVTLEREGVNARSLLPKTAEWVRRAASLLPNDAQTEIFDSPFWRRAAQDVAYHAAGSMNRLIFPHYQTHSNISAPTEYVGYVRRSAMLRLTHRSLHDTARLSAIATGHTPFFVLPLQLNSDAQVRDQSILNTMATLIQTVILSFATHAPNDARLVIKNHPLDVGETDYAALIRHLEYQHGLTGRIDYVETGDLAPLLQQATGTVTLNSTVGCVSLEQGCPTLCLADSIYNMAGLTAQDGLDTFWSNPVKPDASLFSSFKQVLMHTTQINGGLYCPRGIALATGHASRILTAQISPLQQLMDHTVP